jgi:two-component system NtrC family sensor kinase
VLLLGLIAFQAIVVALDIPSGHWIVIVAAGGAVAICFVTLIVMLVLIQRPLEELKRVIGRVSEGDLGARVDFAKRNDDVGQLGQQFNEMIRQLEESRAEIERLHQREMARAEHLATIGELAAGLAHEIRNPLAGIAGVVEVMGRELPPESSSRAVLPEVHSEIQHIQAILNDLLAYARPRPPEFHPADLNATVEQAVSLARQQVRTKPIEITLESEKRLPGILHDPVQVQQVILNLLLNGIQAISNQGKIEVALRQEREYAVVRIRDNGKGISRESLPRIFKPFFTTRKEGTGLGLPLARGIVESHKGRIEVTSEPGRGAQFEVWLPILRAKDKHAE